MRSIGCAMVASLIVLAGCSKKSSEGSREPAEMKMEQEAAPDSGATQESPPEPGSSMQKPVPSEPGQLQPGEAQIGLGQPGQPGQAQLGKPAQAQLSEQDIAKRFDDFITAFNSKDVTAISGFFASDANSTIVDSDQQFKGDRDLVGGLLQPKLWTAFPDLKLTRQLAIVDGNSVVAIVHATGTNSGPVMTSGPTNKKIGLYGVIHAEFNNDGKLSHQAILFDPTAVLSQLGLMRAPARALDTRGWPESERAVVMPSGNDTEAANLDKVKNADMAFVAGNVDAAFENVAEDVVYSDMSMAKDVKGKKAAHKMAVEFSKAFSDITVATSMYLAAGNWVFSRTDYSMTNTGDLPAQKLKSTGKTVKLTECSFYQFDDGKIAKVLVFHNGMAMASQLGLVAGADEPGSAEKPARRGKHKGTK